VGPGADHALRLCRVWDGIHKANVNFTTIHGIVVQEIIYESAGVCKRNRTSAGGLPEAQPYSSETARNEPGNIDGDA
jgi:hypothetical protein